MANSTKKINSTVSSSSTAPTHRMWSIIGVVFALLVIGLLVGYPYLSGKKVAAAGHAIASGIVCSVDESNNIVVDKKIVVNQCLDTPVKEVPPDWSGYDISGIIQKYTCVDNELKASTEQCYCKKENGMAVCKSQSDFKDVAQCNDMDGGDNPSYPGYLTDNAQSYGVGSDGKACPKGQEPLAKGVCYCPPGWFGNVYSDKGDLGPGVDCKCGKKGVIVDGKETPPIDPNALAQEPLKEGSCVPKKFKDYCLTQDNYDQAQQMLGEDFVSFSSDQGQYLVENYCKENKVGVEPYSVPNYPNPYSKDTKEYKCDCYNGGCLCPQGTTGTYPNCECPKGKMFDVSLNKCVAGICPQETTGTYPNCVCAGHGKSFNVATGKCFIPDTEFPYIVDVTLPATVSFVRHEMNPTYEIKVYNSPSSNFPKGVVSVLGYGFENSPTFLDDFPYSQKVKWNDVEDYVVTLSDMKYQDYANPESKSTIKMTVTVPCPLETTGIFPSCVCSDKTKSYDVVGGCITKCPADAVAAAPNCVCTDEAKVYDSVNNVCGSTLCNNGLVAKDTSYIASAGASKGQKITKTTCACANGALDAMYGVLVGEKVTCDKYCPVGSAFKNGKCVCEGGKALAWTNGYTSSGTAQKYIQDAEFPVDAWFCTPVSLPYTASNFAAPLKNTPKYVIFTYGGSTYQLKFDGYDAKINSISYVVNGGLLFPDNLGWVKIGESKQIDLTKSALNDLSKYDITVTLTQNVDGTFDAKIENGNVINVVSLDVVAGDVSGDSVVNDDDALALQLAILAQKYKDCGVKSQKSCAIGDFFACDDGKNDIVEFDCTNVESSYVASQDIDGNGVVNEDDSLALQLSILAKKNKDCGVKPQKSCAIGDFFACDDGKNDIIDFDC